MKRDQHRVEYVNSDGTHTIESHMAPISWRDALGRWRAFDETLVHAPHPRARGRSALATGPSMPFIATFGANGYSWAPDRERPDRAVELTFGWVPTNAAWSVDDVTDGTLRSTTDATTTVLDVTRTGVKTSMLLADASAPTSWAVNVVAHDGLSIRHDDLMILDHDDEVGVIVPPTAVDAHGTMRDLTWTWSGDTLLMTLDATGMAYPIDVDPTVSYASTGSNDVALTGSLSGSWPAEVATCSSASPTASTARLGFTAPNSNMLWLRFPSVAVPRGAIIANTTNVRVWEVGTPSQGGGDGLISFPGTLRTENADSSAAWSSCANLATRTFTWNTPQGVSGGGTNAWKIWNVTGSTTEITDRIGWSSGNAMTFLAYIGDSGRGSNWSTYGMSELGANDPTLSVTFTPDTTPPSPPTMRDWTSPYASGVDYDYMLNTSTVYSEWTPGTDNYKVRGLQLCVTKLANGSDCALAATTERSPWGPIVPGPWTSASGLSLVDGTTYYTCGRMVDYAGNVSSTACSDGIMVDLSTPAPATVNDGVAGDISYQTSTTTIAANWSAVTDPGSGLKHYRYCISTATSCTGTIVKAWTTTTVPSMSSTGLSLTSGMTYYVSVYAVDNLDNASAIRSSNGVTVDSSPPTAPSDVYDGSTVGVDIDQQSQTTSMSANWTSASDAQSGIVSYAYCISTAAGCTATIIRNWTSTGLTRSMTATGLSLSVNVTYYVAVRAVNGAGLASTTSSNGVMVVSNAITIATSVPSITRTLPYDADDFASFTIDIDTRAANGYQLTVRDGSASGPVCTSCGGASIPDWSASVSAPAQWPASIPGAGITVRGATSAGGRLAKWGVGNGTAETDISAANQYGGVGPSDELLHERTTYSTSVDTVTVTYRAHAAPNQQAGMYTIGLILTATANP